MTDFSSDATVRARKPHRCLWCMDEIRVGERHHRAGGKWEGEWQDWRMHLECVEAHHREDKESGGDGEVCNEGHQRGRTCHETEGERIKFIGELAEILEGCRIRGRSNRDTAQVLLGEVEAWHDQEELRVVRLRNGVDGSARRRSSG